MQIDILSLFPEYFQGPFATSLIAKAQQKGLLSINCLNIRHFSKEKHQRVDDRPFGGGPGMVLMAEPCVAAIRSVKREESKTIYLSPQGKPLTSALCQSLAKESHLVLLCGHYEGVDERIIESEINEVTSIGDYVLTSGCGPAVILVDAVSRFIPGVLGHGNSCKDSFYEGELAGPQYTRPQEFEGREVPAILLSGDHAKIEKWRKDQGRLRSKKYRPDLH